MTPWKGDPYTKVSARARQAVERANSEHVGALELRVLTAVLHHTALRSKYGDHVYLAQLARIVYATTDIEPWHLSKMRQALAKLRTAGCVTTRAPRGRHGGGRPSYWIELPPCTDSRCSDTAPHTGASNGLHAPQNGARPRTDPGSPRTDSSHSTHRSGDAPRTDMRPPTEGSPEEFHSEGVPEAEGGRSTAGAGAPTTTTADDRENVAPDDLDDPLTAWLVQDRFWHDDDHRLEVQALAAAIDPLQMNIRREIATELHQHPRRYRRPLDAAPVVLRVARAWGIDLPPITTESE